MADSVGGGGGGGFGLQFVLNIRGGTSPRSATEGPLQGLCHGRLIHFFLILPSRRPYRRIFVYTFCHINRCLSLSDDVNNIKTLNIERA